MAVGDSTISPLSGSSANGQGIEVTATTTGTAITIHTNSSGGDEYVTIQATNTAASGTVVLGLQWGGTTALDDEIFFGVRSRVGMTTVVDRLRLGNGAVVKAWASAADDVKIYGNVQTIG